MNPADLANLINDFATKPKATLFCGAGVGCRVGFPTWPKYLYTLASVCSEYGDNAATTLIQSWIKGGNYLGAASVYKNTSIPLGEKYRKLAEPFGANPSSETLELLKPLVCLPFSAIVSTNYDRSLADAYAKFRGRCPVLVAPGPTMKNAAMLNDFYFARIHGTVETPDSIIISSEDFSKTKSDKCYVDFVCTLLRHRPVMFIGFSFLDPAINSILEIVEKEVAPHYSYEHLAILPSDAHPTLKQFLHKINIRTESYDGSQERQDLWRSVRLAYESTKGAQMTLPLVTLPKDLPPSSIHKILAFAYARNTTSSQAQRPVSELTYEGLVLALIDDCPTEHLEKTVVIDRIRAELGVNQDVASEILELAITNLVNSKEISIVGRYLRKSLHYQPFLDDALARLSRGVIDRVKVTSGISLEASKIDSIPRIIEQLFITRAWDIAAQYAGSTISEGGHTEETIEVLVKQHLGENFTHVSSIVEGLSSLLQNPDDSEARMLAEIGRTAFSVQMLIGSPRSFVHHRHTLPAKIYFDASILLPALVVGHPLREGYYNAIKRLRDAAALSGLSMEVIVADVFLEEILRHREKALQEFRELGLAEVADFKRYIAFYGADRVNVFIGAYAAFINGHTGALNFSDFLASEAPYTNHEELVHYLEKLRFKVKVLDFTQKNAVEYTTVFNGLLEGYEAIARLQSVTYNKPRVLIQHEAAQLTQLFIDLQHKQRPLFVTADNRLQRSIARSPALAPLAGSVLSAIGFYGLIDFMVGLLPDKEIYARLIWASPRTDAARQIRDYLEWRKLKAVGRSLDALNLVKFS